VIKALIATPIQRRFKFRCDVDWMKRLKVRGIVIGRNVYFAESGKDLPQFLFRHELEHAYQQIRDGRFRFYLKYFYYSLRYDYENNPYEVEARSAATMPLTTNEEQLLWKLKDDSGKSKNL